MTEIPGNIEDQIRAKIVQSLLALTIPHTWSPEVTLKYIISYIDRDNLVND